MPTPLTDAELLAELERLITDELNHQNTAQRVRKVLRSRDASFWNKAELIPLLSIRGLVSSVTGQLLVGLLPPPNARPGGPFHLDHWLIEQEEPGVPSSLERLPSNLLCIGAQITIRLGDEAGRYEVVEDTATPPALLVFSDGFFRPGALMGGKVALAASAGPGAADVFTEPVTFSLSNGKTFGKYLNGQTAPWTGLTAVQAIQDAGIENIYPTYTVAGISLTQSAPADGELGESISNTLQASFSQGDAGPLSQLRIYRDGTQVPNGSGSSNPLSVTVQMVRSLTPSGLWAVADYATGTAKLITPGNTPDTRPAQVRNPNAPQAAETGFMSSVRYYTGYYALFWGPGAPSLGRGLANKATTNQGNQFTLTTGTTETTLTILLPPGKTLTSVTDIDNQNLNLTAKYVAQATISVPDAGGTSRPGYTPYVLSIATPYTASARHVFTYA